MKYYKFIINGSDKAGGVLYAPKDWPYPIARDAMEVENWQSLVVELRGGAYRHFHACTRGANMVSKELKELIESYAPCNSDIEFLPVKAKSEQYGERMYFIMHFKIIYDVIDTKNTIYVDGTDSIIKLRLDSEKVKNLKIFNSQPYINDVIVSEDLYRAMKKAKLDTGLAFMRIYCSIDGGEN